MISFKSLIPRFLLAEVTAIGTKPWALSNYPKEHVVAAAWRLPDGRIFTGISHIDAFRTALSNGATDQLPDEINRETLQKAGWKDGFFTNKNRWISRGDAAKMELNGASKGKLTWGEIGHELQSHMIDWSRAN